MLLSVYRTRGTPQMLRSLAGSSVMRPARLPTVQPTVVLAICQIRHLSTRDVFGGVDVTLAENLAKIPSVPTPLAPKLSAEELYASGRSVIDELGLFSWWKPSGYIRYALEYLHLHADLPWWGTIMCGTIILRLALVYVPIMSQRFMAHQSQFAPEIKEFQRRMQDARRENNNMLVQQILLEQRDFFRVNNIRYGRQFLILGANGTVFITQFLAIKKMVAANFPGFSTGGALWFKDLTACDPYYILPLTSALTLAAVMKLGSESGQSAEQMTPLMRAGMIYGLPLVVLISSSQFSSAVCLYWVTSNFISLTYSYAFRLPAVRRALSLPEIKKTLTTSKKNSLTEAWSDFKSSKNAPPTLEALRERDMKQFKKAGRGKPVVKMN